MKEDLITESLVKDVAGGLQFNFNCCVNTETGENYAFNDEMLLEADSLLSRCSENGRWLGEDLMRISKWKHQIIVTPPNSDFCYEYMEQFVETCVPKRDMLYVRLREALNKKGPFFHFRRVIESSDYRIAWLDFRNTMFMDYVRDILRNSEENTDYWDDWEPEFKDDLEE